MESEDEDDLKPSIGGKPRSKKGPNVLNEPSRIKKRQAQAQAAREQEEEERLRGEAEEEERSEGGDGAEELVGEGEEEDVDVGAEELVGGGEGGGDGVEEQAAGAFPIGRVPSQIPPFNDFSEITRDWTTSGVIPNPIIQKEDTCGSVVFTHLLQASYNKTRPINQQRDLFWRDLAAHIKATTKKVNYAFRNMNIPINYIRSPGLHIGTKIGGPNVKGIRTQGEFGQDRNATANTVYQILETRPLGIVIEDLDEFKKVGTRIYRVPVAPDGKTGEHALLAVAKGRTVDGDDFVVVRNSWGPDFGNQGFCRLFLPLNGSFTIYWPI